MSSKREHDHDDRGLTNSACCIMKLMIQRNDYSDK